MDQPATKRHRYNLRNGQAPDPDPPRYYLRSHARETKTTDVSKPVHVHAPQPQPKRKLPIRKSNTEIMGMPNELFGDLFDFMNLNQISNIADTNKRLKALAQAHCSAKYGVIDFSKLEQPVKLIDAQRILRNFGSTVTEISLNSFDLLSPRSTSHIIKLIIRYCTSKLKSLKFQNVEFLGVDIKRLRSTNILKEIEVLSFNEGCNNLDMLISGCEQLKSLLVNDVDDPDDIEVLLSLKYPALEEFHLDNTYDYAKIFLEGFIREHPQLKRLAIITGNSVSTKLLEEISGLHHLEYFEFNRRVRGSEENYQRAINSIASIPSLKTFIAYNNLHSVENLIRTFVTNKIPLEHLHLKYGELNAETLVYLTELKTIKTLKLQMMLTYDVNLLLPFVAQLPLLEELQLQTNAPVQARNVKLMLTTLPELSILKIDTPKFNVDGDTFNDILNKVKNRQNGKKLKLQLHTSETGQGTLSQLNESNSDWIEIVEKNRNITPLFQEIIVDWDDDDDWGDDDDWNEDMDFSSEDEN